jgi:Terpene cyclase DEP1
MVSLIVHLVLGIAVIVWIVRANPQIFARPAGGPLFTPLELTYYAGGIAATVIGYYFNHQFVADYAVPGGNPIWGPGSWQQFIVLGYDNPAASSASQDYTIISLLLIPLFTIVDGLRRGIRRSWLFWTLVLFTSSALALAFYFAVAERQHRHEKATKTLDPLTSGA